MASFRIAAPDEYLAITGMGVKSVKITKAAWVWPFQRCVRFSVQPRDYAMNLQAMTKEKLQFMLPVVFTVGPYVKQKSPGSGPVIGGGGGAAAGPDDDADHVRLHPDDALTRFAMLLANTGSGKSERDPHFLENIVKGIIEGETRVLVSSMTMEEIFTEREVFKKRIFRNIQGELSQFGLFVYNSNVKELRDAPDSTYFESLSRKAHEGATNQARIDVAEAQLRGNVGEAKRKGEQDRELAKINAETAVAKTQRDIERASAEAVLATKQAELNRDVEIARIAANRRTEAQDEELKKEVEIKRAAAEVERLRATDVVKARIAREAKQQAADARAYETEIEAKAQFEKAKQIANASAYQTEVEAKAKYEQSKQIADAEAYRTEADAKAGLERAKQDADANVYRIQTEAVADLERQKQAADANVYKIQTEAAADLERQKQNADANVYKIQTQAKADYERQKQLTDAASYRTKVETDAAAYKTQADAEAWSIAAVKEAEANLQKKLKEAEGISAMAKAYGDMCKAIGGPQNFLQLKMIEQGTYIELAKANAAAIKGLNPKISVWNTGAEAGAEGGVGGPGNQSSTATMRNLYQMLPPLMSTINEQTGITLPEWQFGRMAGQMSELEREGLQQKMVNGKLSVSE